jgi:FdhD protein
MKGQRFTCLAGDQRLIRDADPAAIPDEPRKQSRKATE